MAQFNDTVRNLLQEVEVYLTGTLAGAKLSDKQLQDKDRLLRTVNSMRANWPQLRTYTDSYQQHYSGEGGGVTTDDDLESPELDNKYDMIPSVPAASLYPDIAGYLLKKRKGARVTSKLGPQNRWCAVKDGIFYYYAKDVAKKHKGAFRLNGYKAYPCTEAKRAYEFDLVHPKKRTFMFQCSDKEDLNNWLQKINEIVKTLRDTTPEWNGDQQGQLFVPDNNPYDDTDPPAPQEDYDDVAEFLAPPEGVFDEYYDDGMSSPPDRNTKTVLDTDEYYEDPSSEPVIPNDVTSRPTYPDDTAAYNSGSLDEGFVSDTSSAPRTSNGHSSRDPHAPLPPLPSSEEEEDVANLSLQRHRVLQELHDRNPPQLPSRLSPLAKPNFPKPFQPQILVKPENSIGKDSTTSESWKSKPCYAKLYFANRDFTSLRPDELQFRRGDIIRVIDKTYDSMLWWAGSKKGTVGLVPKDFLVPVYLPV